MTNPVIVGANARGEQVQLFPRMANRHGLIAGATGTGKTITLQVLTEGFSDLGVPVFLVDVKGDLSGLAAPGKEHPKVAERIAKIGLQEHGFSDYPVQFWDVFGEDGTPARTTILDMGPVLIAHLLDLNETQAGVLSIAFAVAEDRKLPLLNLQDLRSMLSWLADNTAEAGKNYGRVSPQSIGAIQRRLLTLSDAGGDTFFGEPALQIAEFMRCDSAGRGVINILSGNKLILNPSVYSSFLFWLLTELFETLPEAGDLEKPKLVFFFDEAHLLFDAAPKALVDRIEQVVRLIRSKGVGIYFITQNPGDIPEDVLGQLGNRIQHALRAFTPKDQKAVRVAAETFRPNPEVDVKRAIAEMGVGEALVSVLDEQGIPTPVEQTLVSPPRSQIGPLAAERKAELIDSSDMQAKYKHTLDSESAHELLLARQQQKQNAEAVAAAAAAQQQEREPQKNKPKPRGRSRQGYAETLGKSVLRSLGSRIARQLVKILMSLFSGKGRG
ncbi:DUF853 family protein [Pseudomaricurvus alcaniphilus]|uniref:helicase HerA-like domain-containing protein n=1 Tax=Pseudomaricurvus alcaniphilus TaxID=1166482 RepID=UPI00140A53E9|nr:helicase HerA-like domain-containing protein [Pseudomaricurvus alcaniphilus]NHN39489.1 DUF853 family protein [Pseudomaricurvus alcaniphilus]